MMQLADNTFTLSRVFFIQLNATDFLQFLPQELTLYQ
jgi:hypothetical protein